MTGETAQRVKEESCNKLQVDKHHPYFEDISSNDKSLQQIIESVPICSTDPNTCNNTLMDFGRPATSSTDDGFSPDLFVFCFNSQLWRVFR